MFFFFNHIKQQSTCIIKVPHNLIQKMHMTSLRLFKLENETWNFKIIICPVESLAHILCSIFVVSLIGNTISTKVGLIARPKHNGIAKNDLISRVVGAQTSCHLVLYIFKLNHCVDRSICRFNTSNICYMGYLCYQLSKMEKISINNSTKLRAQSTSCYYCCDFLNVSNISLCNLRK